MVITYGTRYDAFRKAVGDKYVAGTVLHCPDVAIGVIDYQNVFRMFASMDQYYASDYSKLPLINITREEFDTYTVREISDSDPVQIEPVSTLSKGKTVSFLKKYGIWIVVVVVAGALYLKYGKKGKKS